MAINHPLCPASYLNEVYKLDAEERTSEQSYILIRFVVNPCDRYNVKITGIDVAIGTIFEFTWHMSRNPS